MASGMINLIIIKSDGKFYATDNVDGNSYHNSVLGSILINGKEPKKTFHKSFYEIDSEPKSVKKKTATTYTNQRFELKAGFPESDMTPKVINETTLDGSQYEEIAGLYEYKYDTIEGQWADCDFHVESILEENGFRVDTPKYSYTPSLMTQIAANPVLHSNRPCSISGKELYHVIRSHIKLNINPKYAEITFDYDFCLTVQKRIQLANPEPYTVTVGTKRRPTKETRYRNTRSIKVLETSPDGYSNYPKQQGISANSAFELDQKIDQYLSELMEEINKPLCDCKACNGLGVVMSKE